MSLLRTALAFVRKDFLEATSYRLNFVLGIGGIFLMLLFLAFVSDFVGPLVVGKLGQYGGSYFAFIVLGLGMQSFLSTALHELSNKIRRSQVIGTLEALLTTRTSIPTFVVCLPLYAFLQTSLRVMAFIGFGVLFFDMQVSWSGWPAAACVMTLTIIAFGCLGMTVAGLTIAFKRTEPVTALISGLSLFLGGIYYPLSVLPPWLQGPAQFLPITPALEGLRLSLLSRGTLADVAPSLLRLAGFVVVMLPVGILVFRASLRRAMRDGTLTQY